MTFEEYIKFLARALGHHARYSQPGAIHFVAMDWRHLHACGAAAQRVALPLC